MKVHVFTITHTTLYSSNTYIQGVYANLSTAEDVERFFRSKWHSITKAYNTMPQSGIIRRKMNILCKMFFSTIIPNAEKISCYDTLTFKLQTKELITLE